MAHDRAWRNLASRPISPQNVTTKAWPEAKSAFVPDASSTSTQAAGIPEPNRDRAGLPVAMMVMVGVSFGGVLGLVGWPVLQKLTPTITIMATGRPARSDRKSTR